MNLPAPAPSRTPQPDHWLDHLGKRHWPYRRTWVTILGALGLTLLASIISAPLDLYSQCFFAGVCCCAALLLRKLPGRLPILALVVLSLIASLRYMYWRLTETLGFDDWLSACFGYGLVLAEVYALVVLLFGYVQTAWPLRRKPHPLSDSPSDWPTVDVFIPTYNESLDIVRLSIFAAQAMDWPADKLRVHVLDDGRRDEFRQFCADIGVNYLTRADNQHAKAGNLNAALKVTDGEYITIFDADHVPTRSFLQIAMGWFIRDPKLSMLQTPHFFFSPDPFERTSTPSATSPTRASCFMAWCRMATTCGMPPSSAALALYCGAPALKKWVG